MGYVLIEIVVPLILAALLGLAVGWFLWGFRRRKVTYSEWEYQDARSAPGESATADEIIDVRDRPDVDADLVELRSEPMWTSDAQSGGGAVQTSSRLESPVAPREMGSKPYPDNGELRADSERIVSELHPYGDGSHARLADATMPEGYTIKGNVHSMLYHRPDSRNYGATVAEVWFDTPERAQSAGFDAARTHPKS